MNLTVPAPLKLVNGVNFSLLGVFMKLRGRQSGMRRWSKTRVQSYRAGSVSDHTGKVPVGPPELGKF